MPRRERPLQDGDSDLLRFAGDLRRLRERAGSPTYRELSRKAHYSAAALSEAASGRKLPSLAVTVAFVQACEGDTGAWEDRWRSLAVAEEPPPDPAESPYRGLAAFQARDADWFFGRDDSIAEVLAAVRTRRFTGVFGASGSGKSSLLRAGVLSRVEMPAVVFTPGRHPLDECAVQLAALTGGSAATWREDLAADPANLHLRIRQATVHGDSDLLLVVDQAEELFTLASDEERGSFVRALTFATSVSGSRVRILLGVRADFFGHFGQHPELIEALRGGQILLGSMTPDQLREAITAPAARAGLKVETALVARLVADANDRPAVLPLVSHALQETWRRRHGVTLTVSGYEAAGGIQYAVAKTAEDVYSTLDPAGQDAAKRLFLRLIAVGDGTEDTKRRVALDDLGADPAILDRLTQARLLVVDENGVEIVHEAIIRNWPRLADWLSEDREGLRIHHQLAEASQAWEALNRDPGALYRGTRLARAHEWATSRDTSMSAREREFLDASVRALDDETARTRKRTRRLRQLVAVVVVFAVLTTIVAVVAVQQRTAALAQRDDAVFRQILAEADRVGDTDPTLSAQLNLLAYRMRPADLDVRSRLLATQTTPLATVLTGHSGNVYLTSFSRDGRTLATASEDKTARLWDVHDPAHPVPLAQLTGHTGWVGTAVFSPDGRILATTGDDGTVLLWDVSDPAHPSRLGDPLNAGDGTIYLAAFSPDGRTLATANENHTVRLWNLTDPLHAIAGTALTGLTGPARSVAFSPDGRSVAAGGDDTTVMIWDTADPGLVRKLSGHAQLVHSVAFSPDGTVLASAGEDRTIRLWKASDGTPLGIPLSAHTGGVWSVAFNHDGNILASASADGTTRLWNVSDPSTVVPLGARLSATGGSNMYSATFSPDGHTLATGGADSQVRLWSLPDVLVGHQSDVHSVAFSPGGDLLATGARDATVILWKTDSTVVGQIPPTAGLLQSCSASCTRVQFSPDGRTLAVLTYAKIVQLWNVVDPTHPVPLSPPLQLETRYGASTLEFSPDGRLLATGDDEHSVQLWDVTNPAQPTSLSTLTGHSGNIRTARFSPDGRLLATASLDHTIRLWDVTDPRAPKVVGQLTDMVAYLAFSPDGHTLATAAQSLQLWNITDPAHPAAVGSAITVHAKGVSSVVFSPDAKMAATAGSDHTIELWNVTDPAHPTPQGQPISTLTGVGADLTFSRDGRLLAAIDSGNTVRLLTLDTTTAITRICTTAHTPPTPELRAHTTQPLC